MTALEAQIGDLQTEASRLIRSLDTQKDTTEAETRAAAKRAEDLVREVETKTKEVDTYRERLKQFADYDELKRELEIMKVSSLALPSNPVLYAGSSSWLFAVCRVCGDGPGRDV